MREDAIGRTMSLIGGPGASNAAVGKALGDKAPTSILDCGLVRNCRTKTHVPVTHRLVIGPVWNDAGDLSGLVGVSVIVDSTPAPRSSALPPRPTRACHEDSEPVTFLQYLRLFPDLLSTVVLARSPAAPSAGDSAIPESHHPVDDRHSLALPLVLQARQGQSTAPGAPKPRRRAFSGGDTLCERRAKPRRPREKRKLCFFVDVVSPVPEPLNTPLFMQIMAAGTVDLQRATRAMEGGLGSEAASPELACSWDGLAGSSALSVACSPHSLLLPDPRVFVPNAPLLPRRIITDTAR